MNEKIIKRMVEELKKKGYKYESVKLVDGHLEFFKVDGRRLFLNELKEIERICNKFNKVENINIRWYLPKDVLGFAINVILIKRCVNCGKEINLYDTKWFLHSPYCRDCYFKISSTIPDAS